jgi:hypothetical protein
MGALTLMCSGGECSELLRGYLKSGMKAAPPVEEGVQHGDTEAATGGIAGDLAAVG